MNREPKSLIRHVAYGFRSIVNPEKLLLIIEPFRFFIFGRIVLSEQNLKQWNACIRDYRIEADFVKLRKTLNVAKKEENHGFH